jgi:iron complex transport system ATP-binding protein
MIRAEGIQVRRGGRTILDDVSLTLPPGSFVALIGANGAGKSTLLSVLAGLLAPDAGTVRLGGETLAGMSRRALARRRAFLPQSPRAEWPIAVERLVALGLLPQLPGIGRLPPDAAARIDRALELCDLTDRCDQPVTTLSGGELARAMLARALVGDPEVLIADEPLAGLDPRHAIAGIARLRGIADEGRIVIASIHDLTLAARHATHVAALRGGRLAAFGRMAETLDAGLVRAVFDVPAEIGGMPGAPFVDFAARL